MNTLAALLVAQAASTPAPRPELTVGAYLAYFICSVFITIWVGRSLHTNGRLFLVEAFHQNESLADSVNHLLLVGFYLINIGAMLLFLQTSDTPVDFRGVIELLSGKMGWVLLVLGFMHILNLWALSNMRKNALRLLEPPPLPPSTHVVTS